MKNFSFLLAISSALLSIMGQDNDVRINSQYSRTAAVRSIVKQYTEEGLPGAVIAIYSRKEGRVLKKTSLQLMQNWVNNKSGKPVYGMGLSYFAQGGLVGHGHGGGGTGAGCLFLYVPSKRTYIFIATNVGVLIEGKLPRKADVMKNKILAILFEWDFHCILTISG